MNVSRLRLQIAVRIKSDLLTRGKISARILRIYSASSILLFFARIDERTLWNNRDIECRYNDHSLVTGVSEIVGNGRIIAFLKEIKNPRGACFAYRYSEFHFRPFCSQ